MKTILDRAALSASPRALLSSGRNWTKADVYSVTVGGREVVVKDYAARPWWFRAAVGRRLVAREARVYETLAGLPGIPALLGRPDRDALVLEKIDGPMLKRHRRRPVDSLVFDRLAETLDAVHRRGIALADLHHRNVLLAADRPYLVDLAMALRRGSGRNPLRRLAFHYLSRLDRVALLRMKRRFLGRLSPEEEEFLAHAGGVHRLGRIFKRIVDGLRLRRRARKARKA